MKSKYSFEKSVGGVVYREENDIKLFLLLHYESGHWDFPKGHVEEGESDIETLKREVSEETGINDLAVLPNFKKQIKYFYKAKGGELEERKKEGRPQNVIKRVTYYLAETTDQNVKISFEHTGFEWLPFNEALKKITYKNSKDVIGEANDFLTHNKQANLL